MSDNPQARREKMVRWDADFYNTLSDDDCIICLTEKQVYLVGQIIDQLTWQRTRWIGDTSALDLKAIAGNIEYRLAERMTCQTLNRLMQQIQILTDIVVNGAEIPVIVPDTTVMEDIFPLAEQQSTIFADTENCGTEDKDAMFGASKALVDYITQANQDFLEQVSQAGNVPDRIAELISASPLGILPVDEAVDWLTFIAEELLDEYNAMVTQELLETFYCDIFCLAVANDCSFTSDILLSYLQSKVPTGIGDAADTFADLVQFGLTGTFSGEDYFWYMCYFQVWSRFAGQVWFGARGISGLAIAAQTGLNSPDADWSILCEECPESVEPFAPIITHNFPCNPFAPSASGTIIGEQSAGVWRMSSTYFTEAATQGISFADADGRLFRVTFSEKVSGADIFAFTLADDDCITSNGFNLDFGGQDIKNLGVISENDIPFTYDFTVVLV